jgi:NAD+ kinase|tara:strand:- start:1094 stop:1984 length:891 start_codon:yes stop_codon:yes gene_type:complete
MKKFKDIILFTHQRYLKNKDAASIINFLKKRDKKLTIITHTSSDVINMNTGDSINLKNIKSGVQHNKQSIIIVFGGDGLFLSASKIAVQLNIPILGINFGKIGFLVDIDKRDAKNKIKEILDGDYSNDERMLLNTEVKDHSKQIHKNVCLNDIVVHNYGLIKMIKAKIYINDFLVNIQRSDGIIISSPTGSTAYSMSNGCPIVSPDSKVMCITPVSPHTYSNRPLIVDSNDMIVISIDKNSIKHTVATLDGSNYMHIKNPSEVIIRKSTKKLNLIHPVDYNYFQMLNAKLKWGSRS